MSPVVGAIDTICREYDLLLAAQQVVVVGDGRLVGKPAKVWAQRQGAHVASITKETSSDEARAVVAHADVLILGAGQANLVQPEMIKSGVIIFDAGTSEDGGELRGDADPACAGKASLATPVPGGIGPLTVACLFRNVVELSSRQGCERES
jgi:methylenetetrahydrofolate dehydrogenase (NADP+)/methenyltetrahydrofolate cyclohydrolase